MFEHQRGLSFPYIASFIKLSKKIRANKRIVGRLCLVI